jgi:golgi phosphoprotein 3
MKSRNDLFLYEEVMLLSLKDEKGTMESGASYQIALGAAILADLLLSGRLEVEQEKKKKFARMISDRPLGDELLDECLQRVREQKKRQQLQTWVSRFANTKRLHHRVAEGLCEKKVLRIDQDKVLGLFKRRIYPEIDAKPEREIIERMKKAIFGAGSVDPRTMAVIAIAEAANLLKNAFEKKRLKERKDRIKRIANGEAAGTTTGATAGKAAKEAIQAVQAAQAAAAMTVIIASSVATSAATR